jgi:hypothetical protein
MTKEELAKKKGMKVKETNQTAAESLILSKPSEKTEKKEAKAEKKDSEKNEKKTVVKEVKKEQAKIENEETNSVTPAREQSETKPTGKAGRPKGRPCVKVTINVPEEDIDLMNIAAGIAHKGNLSSYIISLIEKDLAANDVYKKIWEMTR